MRTVRSLFIICSVCIGLPILLGYLADLLSLSSESVDIFLGYSGLISWFIAATSFVIGAAAWAMELRNEDN